MSRWSRTDSNLVLTCPLPTSVVASAERTPHVLKGGGAAVSKSQTTAIAHSGHSCVHDSERNLGLTAEESRSRISILNPGGPLEAYCSRTLFWKGLVVLKRTRQWPTSNTYICTTYAGRHTSGDVRMLVGIKPSSHPFLAPNG